MNILLSIWNDPRIMNFAIMTMYTLNMLRWAFAGSWVDVWYWASALSITAVVTFGYTR